MSEYIERDAAQKIICGWCGVCRNPTLKDLVNCDDICPQFAKIPAADVWPVVLCRDCEYYSEVMFGGTQFEYGYCDRWADGTRMNPDDFCSHGAKKEES